MTKDDIALADASAIRRGVAEWYYCQPMIKVLLIQSSAATVMSISFWSRQSHVILLIWLGYTWFCSLLFGITTLHFRRIVTNTETHVELEKQLPLEGIATGIGWGVPSLWQGVMVDTTGVLLTTMTAMGVAAASVGIVAPNWRAFCWLVLLAMIPFIGVFISDGISFHFTLAIMLIIFVGVVLLSGANMRRAVISAVALRVENLALVNELTEKNRQAEQAREKAEQANLSKSKFLAAASHDLRQPVHAMGLFVSILESRIRYPEVRQIVDNLKLSTDALGELFNALLDISKLDAGVLVPNLTEVPIQVILRRLLTEYHPRAKEQSIRLIIRDCHAIVKTDATMFERILRNLVSNAIRYTSRGGVLIGCLKRGESLQIDIYDTGAGISADKIDKIFDEFYQIENSERDRRKGLGLGLAIVRRLCLLLDIPIEVRSNLRCGSRFRLKVPLLPVKTIIEADVEIAVTDIANSKVLIIDDEALIRAAMQKLLASWGCQVVTAESASRALQSIIDVKFVPDIIVSDYRLRENQTGIDAVTLVREHFDHAIPAILITGDTSPNRLREAKWSGLHLLHKPVSPAKLRSLISFLLEKNEIVEPVTE